jgi:sugar phosphate isomerase/epimerase
MKNLFISLVTFSVFFASCSNPEPAKQASATDTTAAPEWKVGVQLWTFHNFDFLTAIAKADSAGAKFIEAFPGQKIGGTFKDAKFDHTLSAEGRTKIKELLASKGMTLMAFGVIVPQTREEWEKTFAFAKDMGIQFLTAEPKKEHWALADSLAGVNGIKIAIHDHPKPSPYWHPDSVLAAAAGHPNIGACADIGHWGRNGLDPVECLKKLEGHVFTSHLKDIKEMNVTESGDMIVGTGALNIPAILAEMKRQQFKGVFSIEREDNWDNNVPDVIQTFQYMEEQTKKLK